MARLSSARRAATRARVHASGGTQSTLVPFSTPGTFKGTRAATRARVHAIGAFPIDRTEVLTGAGGGRRAAIVGRASATARTCPIASAAGDEANLRRNRRRAQPLGHALP